jgi:aminodeoxyfutalosine deaminase
MYLRIGQAIPLAGCVIRDALLELRNGRISSLSPWPASSPPGDYLDYGDYNLLPGLVNSHCHLELSACAGKLAPHQPFVDWLEQLIALCSNITPEERIDCAYKAVQSLAASGTTRIADISTTTYIDTFAIESGLRFEQFREIIGQSPEQREAAWKRVERTAKEHPDTELIKGHLSPHAPYTAHPRLIERAGRWALQQGRCWGIHLAETEEEVEFLISGGGPFRQFLGGFLGSDWRAPGQRPLHYLASLNWPRQCPPLLFHANHLAPDEWELAARLGVGIVHCPGSHAWFGREPFPVKECLERGIALFLGTDSLASNQQLDMLREIRLLLDSHPKISREKAFHMAGPQAQAWFSPPGEPVGLQVGAKADLWLCRTQVSPNPSSSNTENLLANLLDTEQLESEIWVGGKPVRL